VIIGYQTASAKRPAEVPIAPLAEKAGSKIDIGVGGSELGGCPISRICAAT
jgi:hypothetical protein